MKCSVLLLACAAFSVCVTRTITEPVPGSPSPEEEEEEEEEEVEGRSDDRCDDNQPEMASIRRCFQSEMIRLAQKSREEEESFRKVMILLINAVQEDRSEQLSHQQAMIETLEEQLRGQAHSSSARMDDLQQQMSDVQAELTGTQQTLQSTQTALNSSQNTVHALTIQVQRLQSETRNISSEQARCGCEYESNDPCRPDNHAIIDEPLRLTNNSGGGMCDKDLQRGWYRLMVNGQSAVIPTSCVPGYRCNTQGSLWLDLLGKSLPAEGSQVLARACESWQGCCFVEAPVTVRNCSSFYVYHLQFPDTLCDVSYCVELQN